VRSTVLLLTGLVLVVGGVAVFAADVPGRWILAPVLVVAGLLVKVGGVLIDPSPPPPGSTGRIVTTVGGQAVEPPRPGIPSGRSTLRRGPATPGSPATAQYRRARPAAQVDRRAS
jgi:hypothetical protein